MSSEVTELINALRRGEVNLDEVAQRFRERRWPRRQTPEPTTYQEIAAAAERDPEPDLPGSFAEVYAAYHRRELSDEEFQTLQTAALAAMAAEDAETTDKTE
jgi:hypothetical protein